MRIFQARPLSCLNNPITKITLNKLMSWGDDSVQSRHRHQSLKPLSLPKQAQVRRIYALQVSHGGFGRVEDDGIINGRLIQPTVLEFLNLVAEATVGRNIEHGLELGIALALNKHSDAKLWCDGKLLTLVVYEIPPHCMRSAIAKVSPGSAPFKVLLFAGRLAFMAESTRLDINSPSIPERLEAKVILDWLRESKEVAGIYELRVRDSLYLPHKEEVIFQSLDGFDIEVLDWMRPNMSARPHVKSCSRLKKLTLYVSTWASLSYWVSGDGYVHLNELHELRNVEIFILTDLIGSSYSSAYEQDGRICEEKSRAEFEDHNSPRKVQFTMKFYLRSWGSLTSRQHETPKVKKSTAVEVTQLGPYIEAYTLLQAEIQDLEFRAETKSELLISSVVNVAVIDTGVDLDSIKCFEICGASFVSSESGESPWWFSYHPHGTQMAKVITELNPYCRLLVAKVGDSVMDMTVDRVIQALEWAIKSGADIISISVAFFKHDDRFQIAIQEAIRANIVVIATTAGEAYRQEKANPAKFSEVLSIAATDYWGKETPESLKEHADFMFPGENIMARTSFLGSSNSTDEVSGTSVATAIASGVASLILACHRLSLSKLRSDSLAWKNHELLKLQIVREVFTNMVDNKSAKFVKPWLFFGDSGDQTSWGEARATLDWLSKKKFRNEK